MPRGRINNPENNQKYLPVWFIEAPKAERPFSLTMLTIVSLNLVSYLWKPKWFNRWLNVRHIQDTDAEHEKDLDFLAERQFQAVDLRGRQDEHPHVEYDINPSVREAHCSVVDTYTGMLVIPSFPEET